MILINTKLSKDTFHNATGVKELETSWISILNGVKHKYTSNNELFDIVIICKCTHKGMEENIYQVKTEFVVKDYKVLELNKLKGNLE